MLRKLSMFIAAAVLLAGGCGDTKPPYSGSALPYTPAAAATPDPIVLMSTNFGDIKLQLFEDATPNTVANFIELTEKGFYNGLTFHRIIRDFMIQGGDPSGNGSGGPGYRFADEIKGRSNKIDQYSLCMANSGPDTNGSQFFIVNTNKSQKALEPKHTCFGVVVKGHDVVMRISNVETHKPPDKAPGDSPKVPVKIVKMEVVSKRAHEYHVTILPEPATPAKGPTSAGPSAPRDPKKEMRQTITTNPNNANRPKVAPKPKTSAVIPTPVTPATPPKTSPPASTAPAPAATPQAAASAETTSAPDVQAVEPPKPPATQPDPAKK